MRRKANPFGIVAGICQEHRHADAPPDVTDWFHREMRSIAVR